MVRIRVKGHYSHKNGKRFYVKGHYTHENRSVKTLARHRRERYGRELRHRRRRYVVSAHYSRSRSGRREHIRRHYAEENKRIYERASRRAHSEERILREDRRNPYGIGLALRYTIYHPGYSADISAHQNMERGYHAAVNRGNREPFLTTARELIALANINRHKNPEASRRFREAAEESFRMHRINGK